MAQIDRSKIIGSLLKKGFKLSENDHHKYQFYYKGKETSVRTKISHGSNYKTYGDILIGQIKKQLKLRTMKETREFLTCTLSEKKYIKILLDQKIISLN